SNGLTASGSISGRIFPSTKKISTNSRSSTATEAGERCTVPSDQNFPSLLNNSTRPLQHDRHRYKTLGLLPHPPSRRDRLRRLHRAVDLPALLEDGRRTGN